MTLFICNSGCRSGKVDLGEIEARLRELGSLETVRPADPREIPSIIERLGESAERVVIGGGDGSINLALDSLLKIDKPVGVIPLGTANDLARSLRIPPDPMQAADIILDGKTRDIDVSRANSVSFINALGMGLGPNITRMMDKEEKRRFGVVAYFMGLLRALRGQSHFKVKLEWDGQKRTFHCLQVTVANGVHYGGGMTIADDASMNDGVITVLLVRRQTRWHLLGNALRFKLGNLEGSQRLTRVRCRGLTLKTVPCLDVTADGEFLLSTPLECKVMPSALTVYTPD